MMDRNRAVKRFTSAALALAMTMSLGVAVSAKAASSKGLLSGAAKSTAVTAELSPSTPAAASPNDYSINVTQNQVQFIKGGKVTGSYTVKTPDIKLALSKSGNLVLNFTKNDGNAVNVSLGQQKAVSLGGSYNTLTVDGSVPNDRAITFTGSAATLNVNAPVTVTVAAQAKIDSLKVGSGTAKVTLASGATVSKAAAVTASTVSGFAGSVAKMQAVTAPRAASIQAASKKTGLSIGGAASASAATAGKEAVSLNMYDADDTKNTEEINYLTNNGVELVAKDGVSLGQAMKDVKLEVTHDTDKDNDRVSGQWKWVDVASTTHTSGTYTYRFYPSLSAKYPTVDVKVKYVGNGENNSSRSLGKPSISFVGKSHGDGTSVSVEVKIPSGVNDDGTLEIYVGRDLYNEWNIDEDDAGDERTCKIFIDKSKYMDDEDEDKEVRIQAKIDVDGRKASSNTIKYRLEGDGSTSSSKLSNFSLSGASSADEDEKITITAKIPSDVTDPRISVRVREGKADTDYSSNVKAGERVDIKVTPTSSKDVRIAVTLNCKEGTNTKYHTIRVSD